VIVTVWAFLRTLIAPDPVGFSRFCSTQAWSSHPIFSQFSGFFAAKVLPTTGPFRLYATSLCLDPLFDPLLVALHRTLFFFFDFVFISRFRWLQFLRRCNCRSLHFFLSCCLAFADVRGVQFSSSAIGDDLGVFVFFVRRQTRARFLANIFSH